MKHSHVFAAAKNDLQATFQARIDAEFTPAYNAEINDIERITAELYKGNQALAKTRRHARLLMLSHKKWDVLNPLKIQFMMELKGIVEELHGEIKDDVVTFMDQSTAKMPAGLWIDFKAFHAARPIRAVMDQHEAQEVGAVAQ